MTYASVRESAPGCATQSRVRARPSLSWDMAAQPVSSSMRLRGSRSRADLDVRRRTRDGSCFDRELASDDDCVQVDELADRDVRSPRRAERAPDRRVAHRGGDEALTVAETKSDRGAGRVLLICE